MGRAWEEEPAGKVLAPAANAPPRSSLTKVAFSVMPASPTAISTWLGSFGAGEVAWILRVEAEIGFVSSFLVFVRMLDWLGASRPQG